MKKITEIRIENYKAYIKEEVINLPNGENLLLYGENGSGKSSLFHALRHFLKTSVYSDLNFDLNCFSSNPSGRIDITFKDYDEDNKILKPESEVTYSVCENPKKSTNNESFIKYGYRFSGFLDYSQLLKVYLNKGERPNLFDLINELLGEYIPIKYGFHETISETFKFIRDSVNNSYHRTDKSYLNAISKFNKLQRAYPNIIKDLNAEFKRLMLDYFNSFKLDIDLVGVNIRLKESGKVKHTKIEGDLFIDVTHFGNTLPKYNNRLNEARLSAIAICLYLASLKLKNQISDIKLLYLDDVFVGLDSANRRPILKILQSEFSSYQIMISTYDKSWYKLAKEIIGDSNNWKFAEMYESEFQMPDGHTVSKPLIIYGISMIDKARKYLYDCEIPDYPAAANYMRKSFEELLTTSNYRPAILNNEMELIEAYKLPKLIQATRTFLSLIPLNPYSSSISKLLLDLNSYLRPMLHPLSHYAPDEPIYKTELIGAEKLFDQLKTQFLCANFREKCNIIVPKGGEILLKISSTDDWTMEALLEMDEHLIIYENETHEKKVSDSPLHTICQKLIVSGKEVYVFEPNDRMNIFKDFRYHNLENCVERLNEYINSNKFKYSNQVILPNIFDMYYLMDEDTSKGVVFNTLLNSKLS